MRPGTPLLLLLASFTPALAATPVWPGTGEQAAHVLDDDAAEPEVTPTAAPPKTGLEFIGILDVKPTLSNITTSSAYVNGQIVGTLGGTNSTTVQEKGDIAGFATEQRASTFFKYRPKLLDGRATLGAAFEIDFAWGDSSYGTGGNTGGAFGADQVNLQTRRLYGKFKLWGPAGSKAAAKGTSADLVIGLQFVGDGVYDPDTAKLDDLTRSGGHLLFFGTEAAGVTLYGVQNSVLRYRAGAYTLYEQGLANADDITLWMADAEWRPAYAVRVGAHAWYLRDRAGGTAGVIGSGPTSALSEMQGGPRLDLRTDTSATSAEAAPETSAALAWFGGDLAYNPGLDNGRFGATGNLFLNTGRLYVLDRKKDVPVLGVLADVEARVRYAAGAGSVIRAEALYTSADTAGATGHGDGQAYGGVMTGNSYGIAASSWTTHGCLLLFPDPTSINRQVAVVYDPSNAGAGLVGISGSVGYDPLPNKLTVTAGGGYAQSATAAGGHGAELNARVSGHPFPLSTLGLAGAVLLDAASPGQAAFAQTPWVVYTSFQWIVI